MDIKDIDRILIELCDGVPHPEANLKEWLQRRGMPTDFFLNNDKLRIPRKLKKQYKKQYSKNAYEAMLNHIHIINKFQNTYKK